MDFSGSFNCGEFADVRLELRTFAAVRSYERSGAGEAADHGLCSFSAGCPHGPRASQHAPQQAGSAAGGTSEWHASDMGDDDGACSSWDGTEGQSGIAAATVAQASP